MSPRTLDRYEQVIDVLSKKHGLRLDSIDLVDLESVVTERAQVLAPATFNTEMAVLRRWCEFHHITPKRGKFEMFSSSRRPFLHDNLLIQTSSLLKM